MSKRIKRFRLFAGPNGSGKTTFFKKYQEEYDPGLNINADHLQAIFDRQGFINLSDLGIRSSQQDFDEFYERMKPLIQKSEEEGAPISLVFRDNLVLRESEIPTAYEASFISAFLRQEGSYPCKQLCYVIVHIFLTRRKRRMCN